jgi:hypothetical protein
MAEKMGSQWVVTKAASMVVMRADQLGFVKVERKVASRVRGMVATRAGSMVRWMVERRAARWVAEMAVKRVHM